MHVYVCLCVVSDSEEEVESQISREKTERDEDRTLEETNE